LLATPTTAHQAGRWILAKHAPASQPNLTSWCAESPKVVACIALSLVRRATGRSNAGAACKPSLATQGPLYPRIVSPTAATMSAPHSLRPHMLVGAHPRAPPNPGRSHSLTRLISS